MGCSRLKSISIPENITNIGKSTFSLCNNLKDIEFVGDVPTVAENTFGSNSTGYYVGYFPSDNLTWRNVIKGDTFGGYQFYWRAVGDCPHIHWRYIYQTETPATCTEDGSAAKIKYCTDCNREISRSDVQLPALGHDWDIPVITFSEDGKAAEADFYCKNDTSHVYTTEVICCEV